MIASPVFLLVSTCATILAALFDLLLGKRWTDLILYWFTGLIGFFVGQAMSSALGLDWSMVGDVHVIEGSVCCLVAMAIARWLKV